MSEIRQYAPSPMILRFTPCTVDQHTEFIGKGAQQAPYLGLYTCTTLKALPDGSKSVLITLDSGGAVTPGGPVPQGGIPTPPGSTTFCVGDKMLVNAAGQGRGYYLEKLTVKISCSSPTMLLLSSFPINLNASGETGDSSSVSGQFFGGTPVVGIATTVSSSRTIQDFKFTDASERDLGILRHEYDLSLLGDGKAYTWAEDIRYTENQFTGTSAYSPLPQLAVSNFPLNQLAIWATPKPKEGTTFDEQLTFRIDVTAVMKIICDVVSNAVMKQRYEASVSSAINLALSDVEF